MQAKVQFFRHDGKRRPRLVGGIMFDTLREAGSFAEASNSAAGLECAVVVGVPTPKGWVWLSVESLMQAAEDVRNERPLRSVG